MKAVVLSDRGVIKVSGPGARAYLNGLVSNDLTQVQPGQARFGALLTPQGKIIVDFFITEAAAEDDGGFLIDCPRDLMQPLAEKLKFYKLRAKALVENLSDRLGVLAVWDGTPRDVACGFADPRSGELGWRVIAPSLLAEKTAASLGAEMVEVADYDALRIGAGVPSGGADFGYGDAFPHEANMDLLHGVDFTKGCYVGQEVVSRMQHRGTARTRIIRVLLDGAAPAAGTGIVAGDKSVGTMGSSQGDAGLALVRTDRVADALEAGLPLTAGGAVLRVADPNEVQQKTPNRTVA